MKSIFILRVAPRLALRTRLKVIRKRPIDLRCLNMSQRSVCFSDMEERGEAFDLTLMQIFNLLQ